MTTIFTLRKVTKKARKKQLANNKHEHQAYMYTLLDKCNNAAKDGYRCLTFKVDYQYDLNTIKKMLRRRGIKANINDIGDTITMSW